MISRKRPSEREPSDQTSAKKPRHEGTYSLAQELVLQLCLSILLIRKFGDNRNLANKVYFKLAIMDEIT